METKREKVIFLDIDGVLNNHLTPPGIIERSLVQRFNDVLFLTKAKVVLSTSWRYMVSTAMTTRGFEYMLMSHGCSHVFGRIIGVTKRDEEFPVGLSDGFRDVNIRARQVLDWMAERPETQWQWVCVDDMPLAEGFSNDPRFVQTDEELGLTDENSRQIMRLLGLPEGGAP